MNWIKGKITGLFMVLPGLAASPAQADFALNMRQGVTPISREIYDLHMIILWICVVIGVVVFGAMSYSIVRHRRSRGAVAAKFHESTLVEVIWTLVPSLILVAMAIPATRTLIAMEDTSDPELTIQVTGYQWKWHYRYLDDEISFFSALATPRDQIENRAPKGEHYLLEVDEPLVLPTRKKIRFLLGSNDVIHAWWLPDLGWKRDAIPGFINESWTWIEEPGTYRGQCAELCGRDHGFMPIVVEAKTEEEYRQWVESRKVAQRSEQAMAEQEWSLEQLVERGEDVYNKTCAACHQPGGVGIPNVFPALKGSPVATGPVDAHIAIVMKGKQGTAMQAFADQLSDLDLAAVISYERNAFGNDSRDMVQPAQIKSAR
ncbi:cytochrome c oxidase subunit II [Sedimenticola hydrogenitrophicus]|uniref:cytochrome c oxidase subunit II n=1 Tax=Sedimenticola hydrogenitrophicus TaxID=2967975 RepID=UPI002FFD1FEC